MERKIETAITIALIALAGALFAPFATHRLALWRDRRARRTTACETFRAVLADVFLNIEHNHSLPSARIANISHDQILAATQEFEHFVPWYRKSGFKKATREYQRACEEASEGGSILAQFSSEKSEYAQAKRVVLSLAVKKLLSYAKQT